MSKKKTKLIIDRPKIPETMETFLKPSGILAGNGCDHPRFFLDRHASDALRETPSINPTTSQAQFQFLHKYLANDLDPNNGQNQGKNVENRQQKEKRRRKSEKMPKLTDQNSLHPWKILKIQRNYLETRMKTRSNRKIKQVKCRELVEHDHASGASRSSHSKINCVQQYVRRA